MARQKQKTHRGVSAAEHPDFLRHLAKLGLSSAGEYQTWCERRGFPRRIDKSSHERRRERESADRRTADHRLATYRQPEHRPERIIAAIFAGRERKEAERDPRYRAIDRVARSPDETIFTKRAARRLLIHISRRSNLLSYETAYRGYGRVAGNSFVDGVLALARFYDHWRRPPEEWIPDAAGLDRQFTSLARHLFAVWPVPRFFDSVWFLAPGD